MELASLIGIFPWIAASPGDTLSTDLIPALVVRASGPLKNSQWRELGDPLLTKPRCNIGVQKIGIRQLVRVFKAWLVICAVERDDDPEWRIHL